jgi:hypothetical protein
VFHYAIINKVKMKKCDNPMSASCSSGGWQLTEVAKKECGSSSNYMRRSWQKTPPLQGSLTDIKSALLGFSDLRLSFILCSYYYTLTVINSFITRCIRGGLHAEREHATHGCVQHNWTLIETSSLKKRSKAVGMLRDHLYFVGAIHVLSVSIFHISGPARSGFMRRNDDKRHNTT